MADQQTAALTKNQSLVLDALTAADGPLSAYDILDALRDSGFRAPPQVYRALDKLIGVGLVHRIESLNAFVACSHPEEDNHASTAFAICDQCNSVFEFDDQGVMERLRGWADREKAQLKKATIELTVTCGKCAA